MKIITINKLLSDKYVLDSKERAFLYIVFLHYNDIISDEKLNGMFKNLRPTNGSDTNIFGDDISTIPLLRTVGTHHCTINDVWYNNENMIDILEDAFNDVKGRIIKEDIELTIFLKYINKLINKNKNFCVDYFYYQFVEPLINRYVSSFEYQNGANYQYLNSLNTGYDFKTKEYEFSNYQPLGYCCDDCDGDFNSYKISMSSSEIGGHKLKDEVISHIQRELGFFKTKDRFKNPNCKF